MAKVVGVIGNKSFGTKQVAQVSAATSYPFLKIVRVGTYLKHLRVVVGLNHKIVGASYNRGNLVCDVAYVGKQTEHHTVVLYHVTGIVGAVVRYGEWCNVKVVYLEAYSWLHVHSSVVCNLAAHTYIAVKTRMYRSCSIYRNLKLLGYAANRLYMVGMVVCNKYGLYAAEIVKTIVNKMVLKFAGSNT